MIEWKPSWNIKIESKLVEPIDPIVIIIGIMDSLNHGLLNVDTTAPFKTSPLSWRLCRLTKQRHLVWIKMGMKSYLVAGLNPSEKYEFVSWDDFPNIWKVIKFHGPNPPTRYR